MTGVALMKWESHAVLYQYMYALAYVPLICSGIPL